MICSTKKGGVLFSFYDGDYKLLTTFSTKLTLRPVVSGSTNNLETLPLSRIAANLLNLWLPNAPVASKSRSIAFANSPLESANKVTDPSALCALPHSDITNASLTATHAIKSTPFDFKLAASLIYPGKCVLLQPGVKAPGTPK